MLQSAILLGFSVGAEAGWRLDWHQQQATSRALLSIFALRAYPVLL